VEPRFAFCTSVDGTRIAYAVFGEGPPLFFANTWVLSMSSQFAWPEARAFFDDLAERATVVMFDRRGTGASTREVEDISPQAEAEDLRAVADAAGLREFPLFSDATSTAATVQFANTYPERVQRIILFAPHASYYEKRQGPLTAASFRDDWSYARRVWAGLVYRDGPVAMQRAFSQAVKETATADMAARRFELAIDLDPALGSVQQPVLLLQRDEGQELVLHIARLLPNAQVRMLTGHQPPTVYPNHEPILEITLEFFGLSAGRKPEQLANRPSSMAVILFADVVDSTALSERMGDATFRERSRVLEERVREQIVAHAGTPVEGRTLGDGVLATFASAREAIAAALECAKGGEEIGLALHLGLHAGDVIREDVNVYGQAVSIASRVSDLSAPNEVLVSGTVRDLARASAGVIFEDRGERELKGVSEPVRVFAVRDNG
jgi:class 3 adenylate cyclase/pimeloyl-ACP methyl ester carboxylesterase